MKKLNTRRDSLRQDALHKLSHSEYRNKALEQQLKDAREKICAQTKLIAFLKRPWYKKLFPPKELLRFENSNRHRS